MYDDDDDMMSSTKYNKKGYGLDFSYLMNNKSITNKSNQIKVLQHLNSKIVANT